MTRKYSVPKIPTSNLLKNYVIPNGPCAMIVYPNIESESESSSDSEDKEQISILINCNLLDNILDILLKKIFCLKLIILFFFCLEVT